MTAKRVGRRRALTETDAKQLRMLVEIRNAVAAEYSDAQLARRFGVGVRTLRAYLAGEHKGSW